MTSQTTAALPQSGSPAVAIFDLDGTLTRHDTLTPWLWQLCWRQPSRWLLIFVSLSVALVQYLWQPDRGRLKARWLALALAPYTQIKARALAQAYVTRLLADPTRWNPVLRARLSAHQARGDITILMSASVDLYVPLLAQALHFTHCECTQLAWHDARCQAHLASDNVRGSVKAARLRDRILPQYPQAKTYAYGNAASDIAHLRQVDYGFLVNANASARRQAKAVGIHIGCDDPL